MKSLNIISTSNPIQNFKYKLDSEGLEIKRNELEVLQINLGKYCNQACLHCHVEAGPKRTERMTMEIAERTIKLLENAPGIHTIDLTGGAPELHPTFRYFVKEASRLKKNVIDRSNLTVFFEEGQNDLIDFLAEFKVQVVASLPCYSKTNVDSQRGSGVFNKSIQALHLLNSIGYGKNGTGLLLDLVYNPLGASLPPSQEGLQKTYKKELRDLFEIEFNSLYTITNMPIKRFYRQLVKEGKLEDYMNLLISNFNPHAAKKVMCRNLLSISWDGYLYDCDFNQMLDLPCLGRKISVFDISSFTDLDNNIVFANHCYGCTAGAGSSCGGVLL